MNLTLSAKIFRLCEAKINAHRERHHLGRMEKVVVGTGLIECDVIQEKLRFFVFTCVLFLATKSLPVPLNRSDDLTSSGQDQSSR